MFKILVVEDDINTQKLMKTVLEKEGYQVFIAGDGLQGLDILDEQHIDLIIVDIMMPNMDGYEFTQTLRESEFTLPILMVTAKQLPQDKRYGFIVGTDDYMTKPVDTEEMLLRIKALLRRAKIVSEKKLIVGKTTLYYDSLTIDDGTKTITLPQKEFYLIYKLLSYPNKIFTRIQLMDEIWGMDSETTDTTVNVHVNRLRKKLDGNKDFEIIAVRGLGYKAVKHEEI